MSRRLVLAFTFACLGQSAAYAQQSREIPSAEKLFNQSAQPSVVALADEDTDGNKATDTTASDINLTSCDGLTCGGCGPGCIDCIGCDDFGCDGVACVEKGWCESMLEPLQLGCLKNQCLGPFTYSIGGAMRYRYLDESNRLRPPLTGRDSSYSQWRMTPYLELNYGDAFTGFVQAIDAPTFGNDLPQLPIDENRRDLLQYYADMKVVGNLRFKVGRQFLQYGSQHLVSPLGWANTFRNFEGYKLYFANDTWAIDGFATRPVNGATGHFFRPNSFDTPDQSRWFSGVYATYKKFPKGTLDMYWLWLEEQEDRINRLDGTRHTLGARYAGKHGFNDCCGDPVMTLAWDYEGAFQVGEDALGQGPPQDVSAGFVSTITGLTFNQVTWTPTLSGLFYWGSGDNDPNDGVNHTFHTLFPLGHAYWGLIDNFSGQNLLDYCVQISVKPTKRLTCVAAWHYFDKDAREDAIWNIAGAPFGGVVATADDHLGTEFDLVATYQASENLTLQAGYFWFFYGDAVTNHPVANVANRGDAEQFYFFANWTF